ncbi:MAG: response regulator [Clostridiales bacterium]|nr:response regulator [Clostridiales bacterium]
MRILIAEDDFITRIYMSRFLSKYGECDIAVDGKEAVEAFSMALDEGMGYDLVCLDIIMPNKDGYQALEQIREIEIANEVPVEERANIVMSSALAEKRNVTKAFNMGCTAYAGKPIDPQKFEKLLKKLDLIR